MEERDSLQSERSGPALDFPHFPSPPPPFGEASHSRPFSRVRTHNFPLLMLQIVY